MDILLCYANFNTILKQSQNNIIAIFVTIITDGPYHSYAYRVYMSR